MTSSHNSKFSLSARYTTSTVCTGSQTITDLPYTRIQNVKSRQARGTTQLTPSVTVLIFTKFNKTHKLALRLNSLDTYLVKKLLNSPGAQLVTFLQSVKEKVSLQNKSGAST